MSDGQELPQEFKHKTPQENKRNDAIRPDTIKPDTVKPERVKSIFEEMTKEELNRVIAFHKRVKKL